MLEDTYDASNSVKTAQNPSLTESGGGTLSSSLSRANSGANENNTNNPTTFGIREEDTDNSETSSQMTNMDNMVCDLRTGECVPASTLRPDVLKPRGRDGSGVKSFREGVVQSLACAVSPKSTPAATINVLNNSRKRSNTVAHKYGIVSPPSASEALTKTIQSGAEFMLDLFASEKKETHEFSFIDIESSIGKSYIDGSGSHLSSNALDVLALYIKGQKLLYTEAKTYCEQQLNFLMLPAIFISCVGSIFSFLSGRYIDGPLIIASLNGFNAFLLALISYLKLDAKAQAHKTSAYKFDKLESMCEFNSGKFMFFDTKPSDVMEVVDRIETEVKEIKETNQFILPESIRYEYCFTYSTNIFMLVKKIQSLEMSEIHSLKNCMNYVMTLREQLDRAKQPIINPINANSPECAVDGKVFNKDLIKRLVTAINDEENRKNHFVNNILECRKQYYELDFEFNREIRKHIKRSNRWTITRMLCCDWLKS